jgi:hypothetical protein
VDQFGKCQNQRSYRIVTSNITHRPSSIHAS